MNINNQTNSNECISLIQSLDEISKNNNFILKNKPVIQFGENNHAEYTYSSIQNFQESIVQFSFQCVRTPVISDIQAICSHYRNLLCYCFENCHEENIQNLSLLFRLMIQTRDIISGKGEYNLFYHLLFEWAKFDEDYFTYGIQCCLYEDGNPFNNGHPIGSWKDVKNIVKLLNEKSLSCKYDENTITIINKCINTLINLVTNQIHVDEINMEQGHPISLAAKWIPREKKDKYKKFYIQLVQSYHYHWLKDVKESDYEKALNKACMLYRKTISKCNKYLDTIQIKQCNHTWSEINFNKVTSITMSKQKNAFMNVKKDGKTIKYENNEDRQLCKKNFEEYMHRVIIGENKMKGKRINIIDFIKDAMNMIKYKDNMILSETLEHQWKDFSSQINGLQNFIPMADVSGSMTSDNCNPLHAAIGLSILVAEKSSFGPRVMTFSSTPTWINLEDKTSFIQKVQTVKDAEWGMSTNFKAALNMILDVIILKKIDPEVAENMVLAVFSDMQFDGSSVDNMNNFKPMIEKIKKKYAETGIKLYGKPINAPHILFWNLRKTNGFPSLSNDENVTMLSGFSPMLLNLFCNNSLEELKKYNPYLALCDLLSISRYMKIGVEISLIIKRKIM